MKTKSNASMYSHNLAYRGTRAGNSQDFSSSSEGGDVSDERLPSPDINKRKTFYERFGVHTFAELRERL